MKVAPKHAIRANLLLKGNPEIRLLVTQADESRSHDTHDIIWVTVERDRFANDLCVAMKYTRPQVVAKEHYVWRRIIVLLSKKGPTKHGLGTKNGEQTWRNRRSA